MPDGDPEGRRISFYIQRLCFALDDLCRIAAVIEFQPGAQLADRNRITQPVHVGTPAVHVVHPQAVPNTCQAADVIEQSLTETARCLVTVVIQIQGNTLILFRFIGRNFIIRGPRFLSRMDQDAQLHIVSAVKALQFFVQSGCIGNSTRLQRYAGHHIFFPGMLQPLQGHQSGPAFHQFDLHHAPVDSLGRQIRLTNHIAFVSIQVVDSPGNGTQI